MEGKNESILIEYPNILSYECSKNIIEQMEKNICKIKIGDNQGTGFFCKIPFPDKNKMLNVFITNNHIINENLLSKNDTKIIVNIENEDHPIQIDLNDKRKYTNKEYDVTIIEIKEKENIHHFLELDNIIINGILEVNNKNFKYEDETIYILQYPKGKLSVSYGVLNKLCEDKKYNFNHKCSTEGGSSGSPMLNLNNKVIGIHKESCNYNYNRGIFLNYPIKEFIKKYYKEKDKFVNNNDESKILLKNEEYNHNNNKLNIALKKEENIQAQIDKLAKSIPKNSIGDNNNNNKKKNISDTANNNNNLGNQDIDKILEKLISLRGQDPGKQVNLKEGRNK